MRKIEVSEMKKRLVEMVEYLDKLCDENGLTLYMAGGTLLGAVRHKGFIPWDDDILARKWLKVVDEILSVGL